MRAFFVGLFAAALSLAGCNQGGAEKGIDCLEWGKTHYVLVLPTSLGENAETTRTTLIDFLDKKFPPGSSYAVYDGGSGKRLARCFLPDNNLARAEKFRLAALRPGADAISSLAKTPASKESGRVDVQQALDNIGNFERHDGTDVRVLLLGRTQYDSAQHPEYSFAEAYPNDASLAAAAEDSPFSVKAKPRLLAATSIYWADPYSETWKTQAHQKKVERFWHYYVAGMGGNLTLISNNLDGVIDSFASGSVPPPVSYEPLNLVDEKASMVAASPMDINAQPWTARLLQPPAVLRAQPGYVSSVAGFKQPAVGQLRLSLRWDCAECDLDLYSAPAPHQTELSYRLRSSPAGKFYKDFTGANIPTQGFEVIEYDAQVDVRDVIAAVNLYRVHNTSGKLDHPVNGELLVELNDHFTIVNFTISSLSGNEGEDRNGDRKTSPYWAILDLGKVK